MKSPIQEYKNDAIIVRFDPKICIHSEAIAEQIKRCPSGALSYELRGDNSEP